MIINISFQCERCGKSCGEEYDSAGNIIPDIEDDVFSREGLLLCSPCRNMYDFTRIAARAKFRKTFKDFWENVGEWWGEGSKDSGVNDGSSKDSKVT